MRLGSISLRAVAFATCLTAVQAAFLATPAQAAPELIVVGADDGDMVAAVRQVVAMQGGLSVAAASEHDGALSRAESPDEQGGLSLDPSPETSVVDPDRAGKGEDAV